MKTLLLFLFSFFPFFAHSQPTCNEYKLDSFGTTWHPTKSAAFVAGWPRSVTTWNSCGQFKTTDIGVEHRETTNKCYYKREVTIITAGVGCTVPASFGLIEAQCTFTSRLTPVPTITQDIPLGYYPLQNTNDPNYSTSPVGESITTSGASAATGSYCVGGRQASVIDLVGVEQNTSSWVTSSGGIKLYQVFLKTEMQPTCLSCTASDSAIPTSSPPPAGSTPGAPGIDAPNGVRPPGCEGYDICMDGTSDGGPDGDGTTGGTGTGGTGTGGGDTGTGGTGTGGTGDTGTGGTGTGGTGTGGTGTGGTGTGGDGTSPEGGDCPECAKESTQQANKTLLESIKDFLTGEGTAPTVPDAKTKEDFEAELLNSDSSAFTSLLQWRLPSHQSACPQPSFQAFGTSFQFTAHCDLITDNFGILRSVFITIFSVSAIFIVLKA